jgi:hypothetical protein
MGDELVQTLDETADKNRAVILGQVGAESKRRQPQAVEAVPRERLAAANSPAAPGAG